MTRRVRRDGPRGRISEVAYVHDRTLTTFSLLHGATLLPLTMAPNHYPDDDDDVEQQNLISSDEEISAEVDSRTPVSLSVCYSREEPKQTIFSWTRP